MDFRRVSQCEEYFRKAGWTEDRNISEEYSIPCIEGMFESAASILSEFGDLIVGESVPGVNFARCQVSFERKHWRPADEETCEEAHVRLFMLGETVLGPMQLYISPEGAMYLNSEQGLEKVSDDFKAGLCSLLLGVEL